MGYQISKYFAPRYAVEAGTYNGRTFLIKIWDGDGRSVWLDPEDVPGIMDNLTQAARDCEAHMIAPTKE